MGGGAAVGQLLMGGGSGCGIGERGNMEFHDNSEMGGIPCCHEIPGCLGNATTTIIVAIERILDEGIYVISFLQ